MRHNNSPIYFLTRINFIYIYIYIIYSLCKNNNYSLKSGHHKSVIILWEEDDAKQLTMYLNFKNCEIEPCRNDVILRILLQCKFFDDLCTWLNIVEPPAWNVKYQVKLFCFVVFPQYFNIYIIYRHHKTTMNYQYAFRIS